MGSVSTDPATGPLLIDELVALSLPLQLDVGVTLAGRWFVGAYVQYGWNVLNIGQCQVGESCQLTGLRVGVQALYSLYESGDTPWFGIGTGWEWMFTRYAAPAFTTNARRVRLGVREPPGRLRRRRGAGLEGGALVCRDRSGSSAGPPWGATARPPTRTSPTRRSTAGCNWA